MVCLNLCSLRQHFVLDAPSNHKEAELKMPVCCCKQIINSLCGSIQQVLSAVDHSASSQRRFDQAAATCSFIQSQQSQVLPTMN